MIITYHIDLQMSRGRRPTFSEMYRHLSEADMREVAKRYKMREDKIDKLVNHKNKKFCCYAAKGIVIDKIFNDEQPEMISLREQDRKRTAEILKNFKEFPPLENDNDDK